MKRRTQGQVRPALLAALLIAAGAARADFFNARNVLIGERGALMGGAFTALSDDASAGYSNPAGLSQLPGLTITLAADAYALYLLDRVQVVNQAGDALDLSFVRTLTIPTTFSAAWGPRPGLVFGLHVFTPDRFRLSAIASRQDVPVEGTVLGATRTYDGISLRARLDVQSMLVGPSGAIELGRGVSVGVAAFYHLAQVSQSLATEYVSASGDHATVQLDNEVLSGGLIPSVGVLYRGPWGLRLGAAWQCETIPIHGDNEWSASVVNTSGDSSFGAGRVRGDLRYPHRFALGVAWERPGKVVLAADLIVYAGLDYPAPHEVLRSNLADNRHREAHHADVSLGAELALTARVSLRAGLFTNTSSASQQFIEERVQMYGATLGVGLRTGGLETGLGLVAQVGGSELQAETPSSPPTAWRRMQLMLVLGGSHRAFEPTPTPAP